jgi:HEAT repeat protein
MSAVADELLRTLAEDVRRALPAGADAAASDEGLRRHAAKLRPLARQAPVLARLSEMLDRLHARAGRRAPALLDLLLAAGQVRAQGATSGVEGPLAAVPRSGPWGTPLPAAVVSAVCDGILRRGHWEAFDEATARRLPADLRLLDPLLDGIGHRNEDLVERVAKRLLPAFGPALGDEVRRRWNANGKTSDVRLLGLACRLDADLGAELCLRALDEGSTTMRETALGHLPDVLPAARAVPVLVGALADGTEKVRYAAVRAFGGVGAPAVPALRTALDSPDARTRVGAAAGLRTIGASARQAVPRLLDALDDEASAVREEAALALGTLGPEAQAAIPRLCELVSGDGEIGVCARAIEALCRLRAAPATAVPVIVGALRDVTGNRSKLAWAGMHALGDLGPEAADAVPTLCRFMDSEIGWIRTNAALTLGRIDALAAPAVPLLVRELRDPDDTNRELAARALRDLGPVARAAVPTLKKALADREWDVRWMAALALLRITGARVPARAAILRILREGVQDRGYHWTAGEAVAALRLLDTTDRTAVRVLLDVLRDQETREHEHILAHLLALDPPRKALLAHVLPVVRERPWIVRHAVRRLAPEPRLLAAMLAVLRKLAQEPDWDSDSRYWARSRTVENMGDFGPAAKDAVPQLAELSRRPGHERFAAAVALARITGDVGAALEVVLPALDGDAVGWDWAVRALAPLGPAAAPAVPHLLRRLDDEDVQVRDAAIEGLGRIGPPARTAVPALLAVLSGEPEWLHSSAIWALLQIGAEVRTALGALPEHYFSEKGGDGSWAAAETQRKHLEEMADNPLVVRTLTDALSDEDEPTRLRAALLLVRMGNEVAAAVPVLAEAASTDPFDDLIALRVRAAEVLGNLGPAARGVRPVLKAALGRVRHWELRRVLWRAVSDEPTGNPPRRKR